MGQQVGSDYISSFEGDQIDAILTKADAYPSPSTGADGQVPVVRDGKIGWENQSGGGETEWQPQIVYQRVALTAESWENGAQTVAVPGILADETAQLIQPVPSSADRAVYESCGVEATEQSANSLTFQSTTTPTSDLTVFIVITEVKEAAAAS